MKRPFNLFTRFNAASIATFLLLILSGRAEAFHIEYGPQWTYGANQSPLRTGMGLANDTPCTVPFFDGTRLSFTGASANVLRSQSQVYDHCLGLDLSSYAEVSSSNTLTIVRDPCDPAVSTVRLRLTGRLTGQLSIESGITVGCGGIATVTASAFVTGLQLPPMNRQLTAGPQQSLVQNIDETWEVERDCSVGVPLQIFGVLRTETSSQVVAEADAIANPAFTFSAQLLDGGVGCPPGAAGVPITSTAGKGVLILLLTITGIGAITAMNSRRQIS